MPIYPLQKVKKRLKVCPYISRVYKRLDAFVVFFLSITLETLAFNFLYGGQYEISKHLTMVESCEATSWGVTKSSCQLYCRGERDLKWNGSCQLHKSHFFGVY